MVNVRLNKNSCSSNKVEMTDNLKTCKTTYMYYPPIHPLETILL